MIDDLLREQAALYALDALPADEAAKFRTIARGNAELAELVAEYERAGSLLAETAPPVAVPEGLRARILTAVSPPKTATSAAPPRHTNAGIWISWGIAAALAVAAGALWMQNQQLVSDVAATSAIRQEFDQLRVEFADRNGTISNLHRQIAELEKRNAIAETQVATLTSKLDSSYLASIAWDNSSQEGILKVRRLPDAGQGKSYQLWVIDPNNSAPVSAGVFTVQADGSATIRFSPAQRVSAATAFAVSLENSGGSASPAGPVVLSN